MRCDVIDLTCKWNDSAMVGHINDDDVLFQKLKSYNLVEKEPSDRDGWAWMRACVRACVQELFSISGCLSFSSFFPCC